MKGGDAEECMFFSVFHYIQEEITCLSMCMHACMYACMYVYIYQFSSKYRLVLNREPVCSINNSEMVSSRVHHGGYQQCSTFATARPRIDLSKQNIYWKSELLYILNNIYHILNFEMFLNKGYGQGHASNRSSASLRPRPPPKGHHPNSPGGSPGISAG